MACLGDKGTEIRLQNELPGKQVLSWAGGGENARTGAVDWEILLLSLSFSRCPPKGLFPAALELLSKVSDPLPGVLSA